MNKISKLRHFALGLVLLIGASFISSTHASEKNPSKKSDPICTIELRELMVAFAGKKANTARFVEEKFLRILEQPLRSEGTLRFRAPDYLEKIILKPHKERLVVENGMIRIFDQQDKSRTLSLNDYPPLRELLNGIRFTLLGNLDGLMESYELDLHGDCLQWSLTLVPKSTSAMDRIDRIIFLGARDAIEKITWVESNGDFTVMTLEKERT